MEYKAEKFDLIAKTFAGLEDTLSKEILEIGGTNIKILNRAVQFSGDKEMLYKANYLCRSALRIIKPIATFNAVNEDILYNEVKAMDWLQYLDVNKTFSIDGICSYSNITHSKYLALKTKDAIADQFREKLGKRPYVDTEDADLKINVRLFQNRCTISLDSSGESLHKRGYREETGPAPLNEVLAAGMILISGWNGESNFIDPMCGSGTLAIEAAMIATNKPAGFFREDYDFKKWNDFDNELWDKIKAGAIENKKEFNHTIHCSDRSGRIIQVAKQNIRSAGFENLIGAKMDFIDDVTPPAGGGVMVTNPPYGERIKMDDIVRLYQTIGDGLKQNFAGYKAWIISSHSEALKHIGLRTSKKQTLYNGPLECRYVMFDIYEGSKKQSKNKDIQVTQAPEKKQYSMRPRRKKS